MRLLLLLGLLLGQEAPVDFTCPMDPGVKTREPGKCPRCGMRLVAGIPEPVEFPVDLTLTPRRLAPGKPFNMTFRVEDPKTHKTVTNFEVVHEKLFHLFLVSEDLRFFAHEHPDYDGKGGFRPASPRTTHVVVRFVNAPAGTRASVERQRGLDVGLDVGFAMSGD